MVPSASGVRPIALGQSAAKILSRCLASWLYPLVTPHIHGMQHGFIAGRGTDSALLALELAVFGLHNGEAPRGWLILLDITRAFPSLCWMHLENVLEHSEAPSWLKRALLLVIRGHRTCFKLRSSSGEWIKMQRGLVQGDPLSSLMFIWSLDSLIRKASYTIPRGCWLVAFADDVAVVLSKNRDAAEWLLSFQRLLSEHAQLQFNHEKMRAIALDHSSESEGLSMLCTRDASWEAVTITSGCRYLGYWVGSDGTSQAWETPLMRAGARMEMINAMAIGAPACMRLARIVVWTCFNHLLSAFLPTPAVELAFNRIARAMFRGPPGWMPSNILQHFDELGLKLRAPCVHEMSLRLRILALARRKLWHIPNLFRRCDALVHHEELPLVPKLHAWFKSSFLAALHDACMRSVNLGLCSLEEEELRPRPKLQKLLMCRKRLQRLIVEYFSQADGPLAGGRRLVHAWIDRRIQRVLGHGWSSHLRISQVIRSLRYTATHCPPRVFNALLRVLTDGVVLEHDGQRYEGCLLCEGCGGENSMAHYARSLCWQRSLCNLYPSDHPFLSSLLRPPGIHTKHMAWRAFWLVKSLNWSRTNPAPVQGDEVEHVLRYSRP